MAKHRTRKSYSKSRQMGRTRSQRGGDLAGNPPSAWGWGMGTLGNGWRQFMDTLTIQPGQNLGSAQSNAIVAVKNLNAQDSQPSIGFNLKGAVPRGGSRKRRYRRKGGSLSAVLSQAAAPFALLAAQQTFGRRKHGGKHHSRKYRR